MFDFFELFVGENRGLSLEFCFWERESRDGRSSGRLWQCEGTGESVMGDVESIGAWVLCVVGMVMMLGS